MTKKSNYYTINSIAKTFEVIEVLSRKPRWELAELCRQTGLPKTTVHRIILTLEELGYVCQERERGEYSLTFKMFTTGSRAINHTGLVDLARPYCRGLLEAVEETVNLCIPSGTDMCVIDKQVSSHLLRQDSIIGGMFSIFRSASGKAWLASLPEEELCVQLDKVCAVENISAPNVAALRMELQQVRDNGVGFDNEEVFKGVRCVAAPIFDHQDRVIATISISAPVIRLTEQNLLTVATEVRLASARISKRLGASVQRTGQVPAL